MPVTSAQPQPQANGDWSGALQSILNSPTQLQRLMQALSAQQNQPVPPLNSLGLESHVPDLKAATHQVAPYDLPLYDFSRFRTDLPPPTAASRAHSATLVPSSFGPPTQKDDVSPSLEPLVENANRLQNTYHDAAEIDADVDALQLSLNSLINGLGLDPNALASTDGSPDPGATPLHTTLDTPVPPSEGLQADPSADFDIDAFLNELSTHGGSVDAGFPDVTTQFDPATPLDGTTVGDASADQLTAFLDDVSSDTNSLNESLDKVSAGTKRKSDVADLPPPILSTDMPAPKAKRKR
jgi:hypothetical protein